MSLRPWQVALCLFVGRDVVELRETGARQLGVQLSGANVDRIGSPRLATN